MAEKKDIKFFELLKVEISSTLRKEYSGCHEQIKEWKGEEIKRFQKHLEEKVQGRISEKWFYTHLKSVDDTLPRIDVLNMLCRYAGYEDWMAFRQKNSVKTRRNLSVFWFLPLVACLPLLWYAFTDGSFYYKLKVLDATTLQHIEPDKLDIIWLKKDESPLRLSSEGKAFFEIKSSERTVSVIIKSPYYFTDTLTRKLTSRIVEETAVLRPNDYALMINLFSKSKVKEWKERREKLKEIFAHNASVIQVDDKGIGIEIYNKEEFIDKLSFPYSNLENIDVLETRLHKNKIVFLKFKTH